MHKVIATCFFLQSCQKIHIRENITLLAYDDIKTGCAYIKINFTSRKDYKVRPGTLTLIASRISRVQFKIQT